MQEAWHTVFFHELRTPLASIRGLGEGLRDGLVTDEKDRQRYYNIIVEEVTRLMEGDGSGRVQR